ncbi:MAG TPA: hypothetical protein DCG48_07310, partial [Rhodospirillaceae bacterium]|nr:hypothetical protein [Rhodospirillaceae bacterium]
MHRRIASSAPRAFALALLCAFAAGPAAKADPIEVRAVTVPLNAAQPDLKTVGKLTYRGGVELLSNSDRFGGFSALGLSADGKRMVSLTDEGNRLDAEVVYGPDGDFAGLKSTEIFTLTGPGAVPLMDKT